MFIACGLNHKTAPLNVRESIAQIENRDSALKELIGLDIAQEALILSTCNRTEMYCETQTPHAIIPWLAQQHHLNADILQSYCYLYENEQAVQHLLRVASGLDSMMVGEPQILGQIKQAYQEACDIGSAKQTLRDTFQFIFSASKRIRHASDIGKNPVSIAYAAAQLIQQLFPQNVSLNVLLIGSGETASLVAKYLHQQNTHQFMVASRTQDNAQKLAEKFSGEAIAISDIACHLSKADVVISATACPLPFITKSLVEHALMERNQQPIVLLDLAVPRDIEANVGELNAVHLYNIDDLQNKIQHSLNERRNQAIRAEKLIETELRTYHFRKRSLKANHAITDYRETMHQLAQLEITRALKRISTGHCPEHVLNEFSKRLINKLTHIPTLGLRKAAQDNRLELLELAQYLMKTNTDQIIP